MTSFQISNDTDDARRGAARTPSNPQQQRHKPNERTMATADAQKAREEIAACERETQSIKSLLRGLGPASEDEDENTFAVRWLEVCLPWREGSCWPRSNA